MEDTEELADFYVHRPLARPIARALLPTRVTPNGVTIAGGVLGILAGVSLWYGAERPPLRLVAAVLLLASVVLDCADGQLARLRNQSSPAGVVLDGAVDAVVGFATLLGASHVLARLYPGWPVWTLGVVAMASSEAQCFLFDVAKERYVTARRLAYAPSKLLMSERPGGLPDPRDSESGVKTLLIRIFNRYAALVRRLAGGSDRANGRPLEILTRGQMRAWATIGLGTHFALLYAAAAVSYLWPPALYVCLLLFSTAMNVVLAALLWTRPMNFTG